MIQASASPVTKERRDRFLSRQSVIEMRARERARALLDHGSFRELLGPFDRLESPWLPLQGVVPAAARWPARRDHGDRGGVPGRRHGGSFRQQDRGCTRAGAARL